MKKYEARASWPGTVTKMHKIRKKDAVIALQTPGFQTLRLDTEWWDSQERVQR